MGWEQKQDSVSVRRNIRQSSGLRLKISQVSGFFGNESEIIYIHKLMLALIISTILKIFFSAKIFGRVSCRKRRWCFNLNSNSRSVSFHLCAWMRSFMWLTQTIPPVSLHTSPYVSQPLWQLSVPTWLSSGKRYSERKWGMSPSVWAQGACIKLNVNLKMTLEGARLKSILWTPAKFLLNEQTNNSNLST